MTPMNEEPEETPKNVTLTPVNTEISGDTPDALSKTQLVTPDNDQKVESFPQNKEEDCKKESSVPVTGETNSNKFFFTEIMSTAGPRKNFLEDAREGDLDLGEDVVGCIVKRDKAFFWLLDGTSDTPIFLTKDKKEIISSRLLAQDIGWNLQRIIWDTKDNINSEDALRHCREAIVEDWQIKLNSLGDEDKDLLLTILAEKTSMTVSSTAIFGIFSIEGNLDVSHVGDSFMLTSPKSDTTDNKGRFFIVIKAIHEQKAFVVDINPFEDTRCSTTSLQNIKTVIVGTDGISLNTQKWLQLKPADFRDPAFRKTISAIKHSTCDDKALCVIQILSDD